MRHAALLVFVLVGGGCYQQANDQPVPGTFINDSCAGPATEETCGAGAGCEWHAVEGGGVCVTRDPCAELADQLRCEGDTRCAWSGVRSESASIDLCPVGQSCDAGGYCHARDASGGGCTCVQPIACPANADCPAVECDCSQPPPGGGVGGGTCTCTCPVCAPGEACPPCACDCGGGGSCAGGRTCTCACPACAPGASCPPCDCACGAGNVGVSGNATGTPTTMVGGAGADTPDPCAVHGDARTCVADSARACSWIELGIVCVTTPCPSGACVQVKPVSGGGGGGGGGCGCACPACVSGQSCPPCACDCCGPTPGAASVPVPVPA